MPAAERIKYDEHIRIVFIGEVDHGKSTLLSRLIRTADDLQDRVNSKGSYSDLAHVVDQLIEERRDNMTIDTTEVRVVFNGRMFGLIDAPGHLEFLRNMATGTARADAAVLVVDAGTGVQAQTIRHLSAAVALGCKQVIIAINKMDAVGHSETVFNETVTTLTQAMAEDSALSDVMPIAVPVSALTGHGISSLVATLQALKPVPLGSDTIFPVQDVFETDGQIWIVGQVSSGTVRKGMKLKVTGEVSTITVSRLLLYPNDVDVAFAGMSVAIMSEERLALRRGQILCSPSSRIIPSAVATGRFVWLDEIPLRVGDELNLRCATQETRARVTAIRSSPGAEKDSKATEANYGQTARIELALETPVVTITRLILSRNGRLVAGGQQI